MSDVFTTAKLDTENVPIEMTDPLQEIFDELELDYYQLDRTSIINERWNEEKEPASYILTEYVMENDGRSGERFVGCTCKGFRYHCLPYAQDIRAGEDSLDDVEDCKHVDYFKKRSKNYDDRPEDQRGFETYDQQ